MSVEMFHIVQRIHTFLFYARCHVSVFPISFRSECWIANLRPSRRWERTRKEKYGNAHIVGTLPYLIVRKGPNKKLSGRFRGNKKSRAVDTKIKIFRANRKSGTAVILEVIVERTLSQDKRRKGAQQETQPEIPKK